MPWYVRQRPDTFGTALAGAKARLDPAGILNPGVIVPAA
jgi:alkyldihydroxyacetonephosphate synthase